MWREGLWKALWQKDVRGRMWRVLKEYYKKVQSAVRLDGGNTEWFDVNVGVRQGCVISPLLFDVFVDGLAREVSEGAKPWCGSGWEAPVTALVRR